MVSTSLRASVFGFVLFLALGACQRALAQEEPPEDPVAKALEVAQEKLASWQTEEAKKALAPIQDKVKTNPSVALAWGQVLVQEKKYADAASLLQEAAKTAPEDPAIQVSLGEVYQLAKNSSEATKAFRKAKELAAEALKKDEGDTAARLQLALAQRGLKELDQAAANLEKLVQEGQGADPTVLYHLGVTLLLQKKWQQAFDALNKALESNKGLAYGYYYRGLAAEKLGKNDVLVNDMGRFLHLAPKAPEASRAEAILAAVKR
ncbi:MAG: tetratricopeptide repeat protein [Thermoanaerobaculaceae bacterium]